MSYLTRVKLLFFFLLFRTLNRNVQDNSKFHIQLALAIILALTVDSVVYIIEWSVKGTLNKVNCIVISALDHYFYIAAFMWIGADGVLLCQKVVCDFKKTTTLHLFIVSFVCWGKYLDKCSFSHLTCHLHIQGSKMQIFCPTLIKNKH